MNNYILKNILFKYIFKIFYKSKQTCYKYKKYIFFINKRHSINITFCYLFDVKKISFRLVLYTLLFYNILQYYK